MIKSIELRNFRGFEKHTLHLHPITIAVGQNNAGKSTLVEALRLLSIITSRYKNLNFHNVPDWLELPVSTRGVSPSLGGLGIDFLTLFHGYSDPPAVIKAEFSDGQRIEIYLGNEEAIFAVIYNDKGKLVNSRGDAQNTRLPKVSILPQIGPLVRDELVLNTEYVRSSMSTHLSSLHFRNQLSILFSYYQEFKNFAEESWRRLQIRSLEGRGGMPNGENTLSLFIRDNNFVAEIARMGHGLQMWLQIIWFLTYSKHADTIILDEPDVYMHADLQRKLVRLLLGRFPQILIATHSIEIMSEVNADEILVVDRYSRESNFANSLSGVQNVIDNIGGVQNIHLARLWSGKRLLLLEGKDISILRYFHDKLFPTSENPLDSIPRISIGGWGGWNYVIGSSMLLKNAGGQEIKCFCILDSDYHTKEEKSERYKEAKRKNIELHIWKRKEIENFLLNPEVIARLINKRKPQKYAEATKLIIEEKLDKIAQHLKEATFDSFSTHFLSLDKASGVTKSNKQARQIIEENWDKLENKLYIICGKTALSLLSQWSKDNYGVSLSAKSIAQEMNKVEIPSELKMVIEAKENIAEFSK